MLQTYWDDRLRLYITATVQNDGHKMLAINNVADHLHFLVGLNPKQSISDMMRFAKGNSAEWINKEKLTPNKFYWQEGYSAFSYSKTQVDGVIKYIANQQGHHKKVGFLDEYKNMLINAGIEFDERYIFKPIE